VCSKAQNRIEKIGRRATTMLRRFWLVLALLVSNVFFLSSSSSSCCYAATVDEDDSDRISYGTEVSWPMQHHLHHDDDDDNAAVTNSKKNHEQPDAPISTMTMILQAQQRQRYDDYMAGCAQIYGAELCHTNDRDRIQLNAVQPARQHQNYTSTGYAVVPVPTMAWDALERFWLAKGQENRWQRNKEYWEHGSIYTNHWVAPTYHVPINDDDKQSLRNTMVESVQTVLEKWSGTPLLFSSTYGIRVYTQDSILAPHIDRYVHRQLLCIVLRPPAVTCWWHIFPLSHRRPSCISVPLVISAIVNVAQQNVQEDWVLEVIGHNGVAVNLTLAPGEMILYESHSVIHGRPYPLRGKYYANWFFHFEPVGYTQELIKRQGLPVGQTKTTKSNKDLFHAALAKTKDPDHNKQDDDESLVNTSQKQQQQRRISNNNNNNNHQQPHEPEKKKKQSNNKKGVVVFDLPYYIAEGTREATRWRQEFVFRRQHYLPPKPPLPPMSFQQHVRLVTTGTGTGTSTTNDRPHTVAARGDLAVLIAIAAADPSQMDLADRNGWKPLHEAARSGRPDVVKYLVETHHVDINERTNRGQGGSPLWWAEQSGDDETVKLLQSYGAESIRPELY
jgi:prolyl 4-hydroxylase